MAAITISDPNGAKLVEVHAGQRGYRELRGIGAFNLTDATGTLSVPGMNFIDSVQLTAMGSPAADEILSVTDTITSGRIAPTSGAITIQRTGAAKTSGLKFSFVIRGA